MLITESVEQKIRYVCSQINNIEWSGILFYTPKGNFENNTLEIVCNDIFIMDVGNSTYTEFDMNPEVISYMTEHPELLDNQVGLIHSHHHMQAFFSGTDLNTLKEEGAKRNHFVSLIVNNAGDYVAAITRQSEVFNDVTETITYRSFNNESKCYRDAHTYNEFLVEYFDLKISFENDSMDTMKLLKDRLNEIKENKESNYKNSYNEDDTVDIYSKKNDTFKSLGKYSTPEWKSFENIDKGIEDIKPNLFSQQKDNTFEDMDYYNYRIEEDTVKSIVLQLITSSIIISNSSKIDINKWVNSMPSLYEKRFGKGIEGEKAFKDWADCLTDFLLWGVKSKSLEDLGFIDEEIVAICAYDVSEALSKLPKNKYIDMYIDILNGYLL